MRSQVGGLLLILTSLGAAPAQAAPGALEPSPPVVKPAESPGESGVAPGPLVLDDQPQPLVPRKISGPEDRDRLEALAMFSAARMLENRDKEAEALRLYQRALRYDPQAATIARHVVLLAYRMKRHAEAVRYALKLIDLDKPDPLLLNQLAIHLTDQGEWDRAIEIYESALGGGNQELRAADVLLRMQMGRLYNLVEKYDRAAESFSLVLDALQASDSAALDEQLRKILLGDAASTYNLIGDTFLLANRPEDAADAFELAYKAEPNKGLLSYHLARVDAHLAKHEEALSKLRVYFNERLSSEGIEPYRLAAKILESLGREGELLPMLEEIYSRDGRNVPLGYALAERYRKTGALDHAEKLYLDLVARAPTTVGYRELVDLYRDSGRMENLLTVLGETIAKTSTLESLGESWRAITKDRDLSRKLIEAARQQRDSRPEELGSDVALAVAQLALDIKDYDAAAEFFDFTVRRRPEETVHHLLTWGLGLLADEQYRLAADVFRRGIRSEGKDEERAAFFFYLAAALEMDGRTDDAIAAARNGAKLRRDDPRFLGRVAWVLYHAKRYAEAADAYRKLIEKFDAVHDSGEVREVLREARFVLSNLAVTGGEFPEGEEWLEQVLDEFPGDVGAMNDLGYLWADRNKNLHRAYRMIREAADKEPDNAAYRDSLGWVLYRMGRFDEAVVELEKAVELDPDPVILDHLGDAYRGLKKIEKAEDNWRKAADGFKEREDAENASRAEQKIRDASPQSAL